MHHVHLMHYIFGIHLIHFIHTMLLRTSFALITHTFWRAPLFFLQQLFTSFFSNQAKESRFLFFEIITKPGLPNLIGSQAMQKPSFLVSFFWQNSILEGEIGFFLSFWQQNVLQLSNYWANVKMNPIFVISVKQCIQLMFPSEKTKNRRKSTYYSSENFAILDKSWISFKIQLS